jgi:ABC-type transport system substrate-binding protein
VTDPDSRWNLQRSAEEIIFDDAPWIFLWFPVRYEVISPRVEGYTIPVIFNGQKYIDIGLD